MNKIKILLVDDDIQICESIKIILSKDKEIEVIGFATNGNEAISKFCELSPDLLLMDIQMPMKSGLEASAEILKKDKNAKILLLSTFSDEEYIIKAFQIGVQGYIVKQEYKKISSAIKSVINGQFVFADEVVNSIPKFIHRFKNSENKEKDTSILFTEKSLGIIHAPKKESLDNLMSKYGLNESQVEIMRLVALGFTNKEIADKLFFSSGTIRNYISSLLEKLDLKNRTQLASFYSDLI